MALSGFFLLVFLLQHLLINSMSVVSESTFNFASHFMGSNPVVQFIAQPILAFGVIFHLSMGLYLEAQNQKARNKKYAKKKEGTSSSWMSRNMRITGIMILLFLGLHFYDFWIPELIHKYVDMAPADPTRYFHELQLKFVDPIRVLLYCLSFVFLSLHLLHGFQSAFQSVGFRHGKYTPMLKRLGDIYGILVPLGFVFVAVYHYTQQL